MSRTLLVSWAVLVLSPARPVPAQPSVLVDCAQAAGTIRSLQGVNAGPLATNQSWDLSAWYRRLRIDSIRTHDYYGPLDLPEIFPDQNRDPADPLAYDFGRSDRHMLGIVAAGAGPFLRLGTSWNQAGWTIADLDRMAEVCRRIVLHYNQGWAGGHRLAVRRVEFWNEPNGPRFWNRTPQDFYTLYERVARLLKADDPAVQVGTCGVAGNAAGAYREDLIAYCARNSVPLDFYSWHRYGNPDAPDPTLWSAGAQAVRQILDQNGFTAAAQGITEWNVGLTNQGPHPFLESLSGAAFAVSVLSTLQDTGVAFAHHYRGDVFGSGGTLGLFDAPDRPKRRGWGFLLAGRMLLTPGRVGAGGGDPGGFAVLAGRSADGVVQLLASEHRAGGPARTVEFRNLPGGPGRAIVERWGLDTAGEFRAFPTRVASHGGSLLESLPAGPFIHLIRVRRMEGSGPVLSVEDPDLPWQGARGSCALDAGAAHAGALYAIGASVSGSSPGTPLPGGLLLPLNIDAVTLFVLRGGPLFPGMVGTLDPSGQARGGFDFGRLAPALVGLRLTLAAALYTPAGTFPAASNADEAQVR